MSPTCLTDIALLGFGRERGMGADRCSEAQACAHTIHQVWVSYSYGTVLKSLAFHPSRTCMYDYIIKLKKPPRGNLEIWRCQSMEKILCPNLSSLVLCCFLLLRQLLLLRLLYTSSGTCGSMSLYLENRTYVCLGENKRKGTVPSVFCFGEGRTVNRSEPSRTRTRTEHSARITIL